MRALIWLSSLILSTSVVASPKHVYYDYAKVEHVERLYETVSHSSHPKNCHTSTHHAHIAPSTLLGAFIGGAVGNALGQNSSNKKLTTLAGAVLGGALAHNTTTRHPPHAHTYCTDTTSRQFIGYRVIYRYKGQRFETISQRKPGKKIKIQVTPAFKKVHLQGRL